MRPMSPSEHEDVRRNDTKDIMARAINLLPERQSDVVGGARRSNMYTYIKYMFMYAYMHMYIHTCTHVCVYVDIYICTRIFNVCIYIYTHACCGVICVCM